MMNLRLGVEKIAISHVNGNTLVRVSTRSPSVQQGKVNEPSARSSNFPAPRALVDEDILAVVEQASDQGLAIIYAAGGNKT